MLNSMVYRCKIEEGVSGGI